MHWIDTNKLKPYIYGRDILAIDKEGKYRVCQLSFDTKGVKDQLIVNGTNEIFESVRWALIGKSGKVKEPFKYKIGDKVKFDVCYARKCSERWVEERLEHRFDERGICTHCFQDKNYASSNCFKQGGKRILTPLTNGIIQEGFVVGARSVIMEDYKYHAGKEYGSITMTEPEYEPAYASGKREMVLLVAKDIYKEPFIVRIKDILP